MEWKNIGLFTKVYHGEFEITIDTVVIYEGKPVMGGKHTINNINTKSPKVYFYMIDFEIKLDSDSKYIYLTTDSMMTKEYFEGENYSWKEPVIIDIPIEYSISYTYNNNNGIDVQVAMLKSSLVGKTIKFGYYIMEDIV